MRPCPLPALAALTLAALCGVAPPAAAQPAPTNADVLGRLAAGCLAAVPPAAFRLDAPALAPYLRTALVAGWRAGDRAAYVGADSAAGGADGALPRLSVRVEAAGVRYARAGHGRLRRTVALGLRYGLTDARGAVVADSTCAREASDVVPRGALGRVETAAYPETVGARPGPAAWRRVAEPVLLGGAVAVSTLLFFSLRSR